MPELVCLSWPSLFKGQNGQFLYVASNACKIWLHRCNLFVAVSLASAGYLAQLVYGQPFQPEWARREENAKDTSRWPKRIFGPDNRLSCRGSA